MASKKTAHPEASKRRRPGHNATNQAAARTPPVLPILDRQLEERFERLFVRLIWRLGLASQKDVRGLSQRLDQLERRLQPRRVSHLKAMARKPPASSSPGAVSSSSGHSAA